MLNSSLRRLEVFRLVVDCGGVNAAAAHLGVAQPSVSAHVSALEKNLGSRLFQRSRGRRNVITPAGEALYRYACEALSKSAGLQREMRQFGADDHMISLGVQRALANYVLPHILADFLRGRPAVRMSVNGETQETCLDLYRAGKVDAAILFSGPDTKSGNGQIIGSEPLQLVTAPGHPLARYKGLQLCDLNDHDFVGGLKESQFYGLIESNLRSGGLTRYNVVLHMQDSVAIKNAVMHGLGIACTLASVVAQEVADGKLTLLDASRSLPALPITLLAEPHPASTAIISELLPFLRRGFSAPKA